MGIPLDKFIKNLKVVRDNPVSIIMNDIKEIVFRILWQMSKNTVTDTAQSRGTIIRKFAEKYGFDTVELQEQYFYWLPIYEEERDWGKEKSNLSDSWTNKGYKLDISIDDESLFLQENAPFFPSERVYGKAGGNRTGKRDNSPFKQEPISTVVFYVNKEAYNEVDGLEQAIDNLFVTIENFLFK